MTNNSNVHFNLGRWLGPRWWWEGRWRCGVNPITPPPPSPILAPSFYLPSTHPRPLNAFASCFQVRTERCDWPLLAQWAVPHALCSARVTVELGLPHTPECTVLQTVRKKKQHTGVEMLVSWFRSHVEKQGSRSNLTSALFCVCFMKQ